MNPSARGWLEKYIQYRSDYPIELSNLNIEDKDALLYRIIQPTGLIYGHPVHSPDLRHPKEQRWNSLGRMKVVLLESFFHSALLKNDSKPSSQDEWRDFYLETGQSIGPFYDHLNPIAAKKGFSFFSKPKQNDFRHAEQSLRKNLFLQSRWDYFWASLFHNSLLFLDAYYFGEWRAGRFSNIKWHKDAMKMMLLKVLAAAAHANHIIEREERNMFYSFLNSADLTSGHQQVAKDAFNDGITLDEIDLRQADTWILRRYVLELAILMIWSDKVVTEEERGFLSDLSKRLGFSETELDVSLIAIESFVLENWKDVYFLQSKHSFKVISETVVDRISFVVKKNKNSLLQEMRESKELFELVERSKKESLTEEEKEKVRVQMIDVLKTIPAFVIIALPGTFLTLPLLLKILPREAFPTSFQD